MPDPQVRENLMSMFEEHLRALSEDLALGKIDLPTWQKKMKAELRNLYALQLLAAADGNTDELSDQDWASVEPTLKNQYTYLAAFAANAVAGITVAELVARSALYVRASQAVYYKKALGDYRLPAQPGEGTFCRCGCTWRIVENEDGSIDAFWERSLSDSCEICIQRSEDWNPYHIDAEGRGVA